MKAFYMQFYENEGHQIQSLHCFYDYYFSFQIEIPHRSCMEAVLINTLIFLMKLEILSIKIYRLLSKPNYSRRTSCQFLTDIFLMKLEA